MSDLNYDYLSATTREKFMPQVADNIYESSPLFQMFAIDGRIQTSLDGGRNVSEGLEYAKQTAGGTYKKWDLLDNTPPDNLTRALFEWGDYYASISISGDDEDMNMGSEQVVDLLKNRTKGAEKKIRDLLSVDMYEGTGAKGLVGLQTLVAGGSLGGIDGATHSWWVSATDTTTYTESQLTDPTNTTAFMKRLFQKAARNSSHLNETPNLIVMPEIPWDIFESLVEDDTQFNKGTSSRNTEVANAGFSKLWWRDIPIIKDKFCPAGEVYFLNTDYLYLRTHQRTNFLFDPFTKVANQRGRIAHIFHKTTLTTTNRRMHYKFTGFPTT